MSLTKAAPTTGGAAPLAERTLNKLEGIVYE
jgi:hypothetical protein